MSLRQRSHLAGIFIPEPQFEKLKTYYFLAGKKLKVKPNPLEKIQKSLSLDI